MASDLPWFAGLSAQEYREQLASVGAVIYEPFGAWYHATKFAVEGFSDSLRLELAPPPRSP